MAGVWSSSETMPEQKIELQNVKKCRYIWT